MKNNKIQRQNGRKNWHVVKSIGTVIKQFLSLPPIFFKIFLELFFLNFLPGNHRQIFRYIFLNSKICKQQTKKFTKKIVISQFFKIFPRTFQNFSQKYKKLIKNSSNPSESHLQKEKLKLGESDGQYGQILTSSTPDRAIFTFFKIFLKVIPKFFENFIQIF